VSSSVCTGLHCAAWVSVQVQVEGKTHKMYTEKTGNEYQIKLRGDKVNLQSIEKWKTHIISAWNPW